MSLIIRIPADDGAEYDGYFEPPTGMSAKKAVKTAEKAVRKHIRTMGEIQVWDTLKAKGFTIPQIIDTEETW